MRKENMFTIPSERHPDLTGKLPNAGLHLMDPSLQEGLSKPRPRFTMATTRNHTGFRLFPEI